MVFNFFFSPKLPERFNFMSRQERVEFVRAVTGYIKETHPDFILDFPGGRVIDTNGSKYDLGILAQEFHRVSSEEKKTVVPKYFEDIIKSKQEEIELLKNAASFEAIKPHLTVRIFPADYFGLGNEDLVFRTDLEGTITVLVFDLPSSTRSVRPEQMETWGKTTDELFNLGIKNALKKYQPQLTLAQIQQKNSEEFSIWVLGLGGRNKVRYLTTWVLNLENIPEVIGTYGSLVIIPYPYAVYVYPIEDESVFKAFDTLIPLAREIYEEGPQSITPNLFWYHNKTFTKVPYDIKDGRVGVILEPKTEFREMLLKLPKKNN